MPDLMLVFELNYEEALMLNIAFFSTYFILGSPVGKYVDRVGFRKGIVMGIYVAAVGCFIFYLAAENRSYLVFLLALFILGTGITILQTGANPYVALIGRRERSASRLTLVQGFNALGTFLAALIGAALLRMGQNKAGMESLDPEAYKAAQAHYVEMPYLFLGAVLVLLAIFISFAFTRLPKITTEDMEPLIKESVPPRRFIIQFPHTMLGAIAIFAYVGAEVAVGNFLVTKSAMHPYIENLIPIYWGGSMVGRFIGAFILTKIGPRKLVGTCALIACALIVSYIIVSPGLASDKGIGLLLAAGLFNSVLFPCIFTLAIDGLGRFSEEGSSVQVMAIVGGAVIPFWVGDIAGSVSLEAAFAIVAICYIFIAFFGFRGSVYEKRTDL